PVIIFPYLTMTSSSHLVTSPLPAIQLFFLLVSPRTPPPDTYPLSLHDALPISITPYSFSGTKLISTRPIGEFIDHWETSRCTSPPARPAAQRGRFRGSLANSYTVRQGRSMMMARWREASEAAVAPSVCCALSLMSATLAGRASGGDRPGPGGRRAGRGRRPHRRCESVLPARRAHSLLRGEDPGSQHAGGVPDPGDAVQLPGEGAQRRQRAHGDARDHQRPTDR